MAINKRVYKFAWSDSNSLFMPTGIKFKIGSIPILTARPRNAVFACKKRVVRAYYLGKDLEKARRVGREICNKAIMSKYFRGCEKIERDFIEFIAKLDQVNLRTLPDAEVLAYLRRHLEILMTFFNYYQITVVPEFLEFSDKKLKETIKNDDEINTLVQPSKLTEVELTEMELLKLSLDNRINDKLIWNYIKTFPQIGYNTYDAGEVIKFIESKLDKLKKWTTKEKKERIAQINSKKSKLKKRQQEILNKYKAPAVVSLVRILQNLGFWRFRLKNEWSGAEFLALKLFEEIARRVRVDVNTLMWVYSFNDVANALLDKKPLSKKEIMTRKKSYTVILTNGKDEILTGQKEKDFLEKYIDNVEGNKKIDELRGQVANKGAARGLVKIIHADNIDQLKKDEKNFKTGQVLVASMTQINIVHIMKRASAILTEQGGIACHAAIISRELNKPCIIGINNLTHILKDGDLIEVDANKGVVKIIKRAKK